MIWCSWKLHEHRFYRYLQIQIDMNRYHTLSDFINIFTDWILKTRSKKLLQKIKNSLHTPKKRTLLLDKKNWKILKALFWHVSDSSDIIMQLLTNIDLPNLFHFCILPGVLFKVIIRRRKIFETNPEKYLIPVKKKKGNAPWE